MPVYSIKEYAELCSKKPKDIHVYISRGVVVKRKDNLIDDKHPANAEFLKKHSKKEEIIIEESPTEEIKEVIKPKEPKQKPVKEPEPKIKTKPQRPPIENSEPVEERYISSNVLNKLKAEKTKWEIELLKQKSNIQSGKTIHISVAENVTSVHFNSITAVFFNSIDNEISDICNDLGVNREKLTNIRGKLKHIINDSVEKAKQKSRKDLIAATENYEEPEEEND